MHRSCTCTLLTAAHLKSGRCSGSSAQHRSMSSFQPGPARNITAESELVSERPGRRKRLADAANRHNIVHALQRRADTSGGANSSRGAKSIRKASAGFEWQVQFLGCWRFGFSGVQAARGGHTHQAAQHHQAAEGAALPPLQRGRGGSVASEAGICNRHSTPCHALPSTALAACADIYNCSTHKAQRFSTLTMQHSAWLIAV